MRTDFEVLNSIKGQRGAEAERQRLRSRDREAEAEAEAETERGRGAEAGASSCREGGWAADLKLCCWTVHPLLKLPVEQADTKLFSRHPQPTRVQMDSVTGTVALAQWPSQHGYSGTDTMVSLSHWVSASLQCLAFRLLALVLGASQRCVCAPLHSPSLCAPRCVPHSNALPYNVPHRVPHSAVCLTVPLALTCCRKESSRCCWDAAGVGPELGGEDRGTST